MAPRVMTVSGPIPPDRVGFALPHEHTRISLWHIPGRFDYWELAADELTVAEELRDFRDEAGARSSTSPSRASAATPSGCAASRAAPASRS